MPLDPHIVELRGNFPGLVGLPQDRVSVMEVLRLADGHFVCFVKWEFIYGRLDLKLDLGTHVKGINRMQISSWLDFSCRSRK